MTPRLEKSSAPKLDEIDMQILEILQEDARISLKELSSKINLSSTPTFERWRRLERHGYVERYITILNADKVHRGFTVYCSVKLRSLAKPVITDFMRVVQDIHEVSECYHISGKYDYLLKINAPDMKYYKDFIVNVLGQIDAIGAIESSFVMDHVKQSYNILKA